ncbi:MAG: transposase [Armatimonadetes bacterium]|nr:transposase [Armatimonadota bacterium]
MGHAPRGVGAFGAVSERTGDAPAPCRRQPERAVYGKWGARGYDAGKKIKGRKRHIAVDSQGNVLGVWVSAADVSTAQGAYQVLDEVLARYREVQVVIADSA